ncbi:MAG: response regulator [Anaerolineae bacterium]|nr:response regulator [Anaerolineae bacterium]
MCTVLVAGDDVVLRSSMRSILTQAGVNTVVVESGPEALLAVRQQAFDMVFLDVLTSALNGLETLRLLHSSDPDLKVCLLTVLSDLDLLAQAAGDRAVGFLAKPVERRSVLEVLEMWCGFDTRQTRELRSWLHPVGA